MLVTICSFLYGLQKPGHLLGKRAFMGHARSLNISRFPGQDMLTAMLRAAMFRLQ